MSLCVYLRYMILQLCHEDGTRSLVIIEATTGDMNGCQHTLRPERRISLRVRSPNLGLNRGKCRYSQ